MNKVILYSPEIGVYLGSCMGLGFWSKLDPAGQSTACVFDSEEDAIEYMETWDEVPSSDIEVLDIVTANENYATIKECVQAGAEAWCFLEMDENDKKLFH